MQRIKFCKKRDGSVVPFDKTYITNAIIKAFKESNEGNKFIAQKTTESVVKKILCAFPHQIPSVEDIQDIVEETLIEYNFRMTAKNYILYRSDRQRKRTTLV